MKERPILFNAEMVKAILDGRKTCTRRVIKDAVKENQEINKNGKGEFELYDITPRCGIPKGKLYKPPYQPGDILYVRETWQNAGLVDEFDHVIAGTEKYYYAAGPEAPCFDFWVDPETGEHKDCMPWKPSIHMPKEAARIWLKVTDVRVERLQEITEDQTEEEGFLFTPPCLHLTGENYCDIDGPCTSKVKYCDMGAGELFGKVLWNSTIKKTDLDRYGWDANPYVWVIEFERCEKPDLLEGEG